MGHVEVLNTYLAAPGPNERIHFCTYLLHDDGNPRECTSVYIEKSQTILLGGSSEARVS